MENYKQVVKTVRDLSNINAHGEALELISKFFGLGKHRKQIIYINELRHISGDIDPDLQRYRDKIGRDIISEVRKKFGDRIGDEINACL